MAKFEEAFEETLKLEGNYSNHKDDLGGETYFGISRIKWPFWDGWIYVDSRKRNDLTADESIILSNKVKSFYQDNFWNQIQGKLISSQLIANELFDSSVNIGKVISVKFLQRSLNILNNNSKRWIEIRVDGYVGGITLSVISLAISMGFEENILKLINILQGMHYIELVERLPDQEININGWLKRTNFIKNVKTL